MIYSNMHSAVFIDRPNRFIANILLNGEKAVCHVKNTGRCRELLTPSARVLVQKSDSPGRKTAYDMISVYKRERLINIDSAAPNAVAAEWLCAGGLGFEPDLIRAEVRRGDSRFDFYFEHCGRGAYMEVKGVTLEERGVVRFPDAPTERGLKHLRGLMEVTKSGMDAYALFVVQMQDVLYFEPNTATHPQFAEALREARDAGVNILAMNCRISEESIEMDKPVQVRL